MALSNAMKACAVGIAFTLAPIAASAAVVSSGYTTNDYSSIDLGNTATLPANSYWIAAPSNRAGNASGTYRSPFDETENINSYFNSEGIAENTPYFAVGPDNPNNPATLGFTVVQQALSFLWGSPDEYNTLTFRLDGVEVGTFGGDEFPPETFGSSYVNFTGLFDEVEFYSDPNNAFEFAAIETTPVPLPAGAVLLLTGLGGFAAYRRRKA